MVEKTRRPSGTWASPIRTILCGSVLLISVSRKVMEPVRDRKMCIRDSPQLLPLDLRPGKS